MVDPWRHFACPNCRYLTGSTEPELPEKLKALCCFCGAKASNWYTADPRIMKCQGHPNTGVGLAIKVADNLKDEPKTEDQGPGGGGQ